MPDSLPSALTTLLCSARPATCLEGHLRTNQPTATAGEYLLLPCWDGVPPTPAQIEQAAQLTLTLTLTLTLALALALALALVLTLTLIPPLTLTR